MNLSFLNFIAILGYIAAFLKFTKFSFIIIYICMCMCIHIDMLMWRLCLYVNIDICVCIYIITIIICSFSISSPSAIYTMCTLVVLVASLGSFRPCLFFLIFFFLQFLELTISVVQILNSLSLLSPQVCCLNPYSELLFISTFEEKETGTKVYILHYFFSLKLKNGQNYLVWVSLK